MDRVEGKSADMLDEKIAQLGKIFPEFLTEARGADGKLKRAFDFDALKNLLSDRLPETNDMYQFSWVGKTTARAEAYRRIDKTLRPCLARSVDWDKTRNLYIEGDNLEVLKLLQRGYMNKVKMIYIDPPYNTGRDFIYHDRHLMPKPDYAAEVDLFDEESGDKNFVENSESNPRFHSDWCSMIYARLLLARNLLTDDGVIFISIDDSEQANLRKICDEVFGEENFVANVIWEKKYSPQNAAQYLSDSHDFILLYAKDKNIWRPNLLPRTVEMDARYKNPDNDPRGPWKSTDSTAQAGHGTPSQFYVLKAPNGREYELPRGRCWLYTEKRMSEAIADNRISFGKDGDGIPRVKTFLSEVKQGTVSKTIWFRAEVGDNQEANRELKNIFDGSSVFDTPKPVRLIEKMLRLATDSDSLVMDFFSGSATTAHAVMQLNAEDNGNRRFIMVQIPDPCPANSEAAKAGYKTICDIGRARIKLAGQKIKDAAPLTTTNLDVGFRCLKVDTTNFNDVYLTASELTQEKLEGLEENIKPDRSALDLLYGCLLDWNVELSLPYTSEKYGDATLHNYGDGALIACFDSALDESVIEYIAKKKPLRAVFRDSSFGSDAARLNAEEIMKLHSPGTDVKVI